MNLSVESRVKAHISTAYIDADGRGTQSTYAVDYADCMKSPAEFQKIQRGEGSDDALLRDLEARHAAVLKTTREFYECVQAREAARLKTKVEEAASTAVLIDVKRVEQRLEEKQHESAALDEAYHHRLDDDDAMTKYESLLRESSESKLRRKEEDVIRRHSQLADLARRSKAQQELLIQQQKERAAHMTDIENRMVQETLEARRRQEKEEAERQWKEDAKKAIDERMRQERLHKEFVEIRLKAQLEQEQAEQEHKRCVAKEQEAVRLAADEVKAQLAMANKNSDSAVQASYETLRRLQQEHEAAAQRIQLEIQRHCGSGSFLELLMMSAHDSSQKEGTPFAGLDLLCNATLKRSVSTPTVRPVAEGAQVTKSVATMTEAVASSTRNSTPGQGARRK